jgi:hypothetical protein
MVGTFRTHGSGKKFIQHFIEKTCREQTTWETQAEILCGDAKWIQWLVLLNTVTVLARISKTPEDGL